MALQLRLRNLEPLREIELMLIANTARSFECRKRRSSWT